MLNKEPGSKLYKLGAMHIDQEALYLIDRFWQQNIASFHIPLTQPALANASIHIKFDYVEDGLWEPITFKARK